VKTQVIISGHTARIDDAALAAARARVERLQRESKAAVTRTTADEWREQR
jgi:hypothetical protein